MATTTSKGDLTALAAEKSKGDDPFTATPMIDRQKKRFSLFDDQTASLLSDASPAHAKGIVEAHLAETDRRLREASELGTVLVKQRKDLSERLKDLEARQSSEDLDPELRRKLDEIEAEFNETGRQTFRAFLAKSRVSSSENVDPTASPAFFSTEAHPSPSKVSAPSRKQRSQYSNRENDLKFAADLSSSMIVQIRELQAALAEKTEALNATLQKKSQLEVDFEGVSQRLRSMAEMEQRYKDENWNLEVQVHEMSNEAREAATREQRLTSSVNTVKNDKSVIEQELEELKQIHTKLNDTSTLVKKQNETEINQLRRNVAAEEAERVSLEKRVEELFSQNQELAKGLAVKMRTKDHSSSDENDDSLEHEIAGREILDHSPPPSPSKGTPRHGHLESETLKSSLHHAHRMIQNLKNNIHREKTEKMELKRMLQDVRDEIETKRNDNGYQNGAKKRKPANQQDVFKKPVRPDRLGGIRGAREEVISDVDWEDQEGPDTPSKASNARNGTPTALAPIDSRTDRQRSAAESDAFETAEENSDAFNTANEKDGTVTETDAFLTGAETLDGDSSGGDLTETEHGMSRPIPFPRMKPSGRASFISTASTSGDEDDSLEVKTPLQSHHNRYKIRVSKVGSRRSVRESSEPLKLDTPGSSKDSPASFVSNQSQSAVGPSLLAELGQFDDENAAESSLFEGTPSQASTVSRDTTPALQSVRLRPNVAKKEETVVEKIKMIEKGTMTDDWQPDHVAAPRGQVGSASVHAGVIKDDPVIEDISSAEDVMPKYAPTQSIIGSTENTRRIVSSGSSGSWNRSFVLHPDSGFSSADNSLLVASNESMNPELLLEKIDEKPVAPLMFSGIDTQSTEPDTDVDKLQLLCDTNTDEPDSSNAMAANKEEQVPTRQAEARHMAMSFSSVISSNIVPTEQSKSEELMQPVAIAVPAIESSQISSASSYGLWPAKHTARNMHYPSLFKNEPSGSNVKSAFEVNGDEHPSQTTMSDEGTQTLMSAKEMEDFIGKKSNVVISDATQTSPTLAQIKASPRSSKRSSDGTNGTDPLFKTPRRPSSSSSMRRSGTPPPLPFDHRQVIAAAAHKTPSGAATIGSMGPPIMPASAYRRGSLPRPCTPSFNNGQAQITTPKGSSTPRARVGPARSEASPITRRSSVSSFASEIDERFNMSRTPMLPEGLEANDTDPRVIQAIVQTMIGDFLWKYTRKAGRQDMSNNRHRRFFWVHPYTRTLYWSEQDPAKAGKSQMKAKSVAIQAVRVVTDNNPMPPGLHRKSLVILTPGRSIVFTCPTSQKHDTWFNALSFLLLRTAPERENDMTNITAQDVDEFNPQIVQNSSQTRGTRASITSYASRTQHVPSPQRSTVGGRDSIRAINNSRQTHRSQNSTATASAAFGNGVGVGAVEPATPERTSPHLRSDHGSVSGRFSSLSGMFKANSSIRASISSRRSRRMGAMPETLRDVTDAKHDSVEDFRKVIERDERANGGVDNVRTCCDGKLLLKLF